MTSEELSLARLHPFGLLVDQMIQHVYEFRDGRIQNMEIRDKVQT